MPLPSGIQFGSYKLLALIGAGGMGEVYRAHDERLGRDVAVKVLPESFTEDPERLRRFESEARAAGALNHPNIVAVHDLGSHEGSPYLVMELLEGETLRARMGGRPMAARKAVELALQVAQGLAAAHEKGIVHRDLKPENLFLTRDGRVKILDFGLAKRQGPAPGGRLATLTEALSEPGQVVGTSGYMSPEQVRGEAVDARSDLFSLGVVLWELLTGGNPFLRATALEAMHAILKEDPPALDPGLHLAPTLERILFRCLAKEREARFHSAGDLAFALDNLAQAASTSTPGIPVGPSLARRRRIPGAILLLLAGVLAGAALLGALRGSPPPVPTFHRLTFFRGTLGNADFAQGGQTIVYSARVSGRPSELYALPVGSIQATRVGDAQALLLGVSSRNELALMRDPRDVDGQLNGTMARAPWSGAGLRDMGEYVWGAAWHPQGEDLAMLTAGYGDSHQIEYPRGHVLYNASAVISGLAFAPGGDHLAFLERSPDGPFLLKLLDLQGNARTLALIQGACATFAWGPRDGELWVAGAEAGQTSLEALSIRGARRLLWRGPGVFRLLKVGGDGQALLCRDDWHFQIGWQKPGQTVSSELSWLDGSVPVALSRDGSALLFNEVQIGGGKGGSIYLRRLDGSPPVRLGSGLGMGLSPDGREVLAYDVDNRRLLRMPTGPGQVRALPLGSLVLDVEPFFSARGAGSEAHFLPDGGRVLVEARPSSGEPLEQLWQLDLETGKAEEATPRGVTTWNFQQTLSPDGKFLACVDLTRAVDADKLLILERAHQTVVRRIPLQSSEVPFGWTRDGKAVYVRDRDRVPALIFRLDLATGARRFWCQVAPPDPAGVPGIPRIILGSGEDQIVFGYPRILSELFLVEGLR